MAQVIPMVMLAGTALSAVGAVSQANAQTAAYGYNAQLNQRNAAIATQQTEAEVARVRRQADLVQGAMRAKLGASGFTVEGSALDALTDSAAQAQLDIETVKYRGHLKAMGYHDNAELDRMAGETSRTQGGLRAASEVLTGFGRAGDAYFTGSSYSAGARRIPVSDVSSG